MSRRKAWATAALLVLFAGVLVLLDRQLAGKLHPNATTIALVLLAILLVIVLLYPHELKRFIERIGSLRVGSFEVGLTQAERARVVYHLPREDELKTKIPKLKRTGRVLDDLYVVRKSLVDRLWLGKELQFKADGAGDVLRQLRTIDLVNDDQARFAADLLLPELSDLPSLPSDEQDLYANRGWDFANRLRPNVFDQAVRASFRVARWRLLDFEQSPEHRADFLANANATWLLVAPRIALNHDSDTNIDDGQIAKTIRRWTETEPSPPVPVDHRLIVIPKSRAPTLKHGDIIVERRQDLHRLLDERRSAGTVGSVTHGT